MNTMILALALFAGMYVLLLIFADYRWIIALSAAVVWFLCWSVSCRRWAHWAQSTGTY